MTRPPLPAGPVLVVGLARSGVSAATLLAELGYDVTAVDAGRPEADLPDDVRVKLETDGLAQLEHAAWVVKSPGVPREAPVIAAALERGLPVLGELELGWRLLPNEFVAVTGTNGKTTTVELIGHIHRVAAIPVAVAGNVGRALTSLAGGKSALPGHSREPSAREWRPGRVGADAVIVCECSSFQLEDASAFAPEAAVLLNVEPDHLDRHGTFGAYRDAKLRIFARQGNDDIAVAPSGLDVEDLGGCARRVCFGERSDSELALRSGQLFWDDEPLIAAGDLSLRGHHNVLNAMAAAAVCLSRGIDPGAVAEGLRTFPGVEHRAEELPGRDGIRFVNDSKATNVASTLVALEAFAGERVHLILGGEGKGQDFAPLREAAGTCAGVYLIGEAADQIGAAIGTGEPCGTLAVAVERARRSAHRGDVVLLSPACASYDQFADFEARGRAFKELVAT